jgi:hypothetical protein
MPGRTSLVLAITLDAAMAAHHQPPQEPLIRLSPPRAEVGVIASDALCSFKKILAEYGWHWDLDPFFARSKLETSAFAASCRRKSLVTVVRARPL